MNRYVRIFICILLLLSITISVAFADDDNSDNSGNTSTSEETRIEQLRVSPSDTSGLHALLLSLIGDYNPVVKDYTYTTTSYNGTVQTNHSIEITPDWSWIMTCALFIVVIYCVFRLFGLALGGVKV